ncbi:iduronate 2-sulfatase isoform X1 [Macrosteles quadrilineatus]|uniref:iduronate 2-sulfatase isoform X1 n=1 Tax=Macrosteles quadrilineatus TaxID=74068 RepID=UPI0023E2F74C|nr:iduronate 2-sulfatase isoform X1 [Macrosteles quadrilineatus]
MLIFIYVVLFSINLMFSALGKQNILVIISDDLRPSLGCYGDKNAFTPNIDALCEESVRFSNAFAQQALCAPSRNSFLTSRRPDTLNLYDFYSYWRDIAGNFTTLPQYFKEQGYFTKSVGKVFHPGISSNFSDDQPYSWSCDPYHPPTEVYKDAAVCPRTGSLCSDLVCPVDPALQPGGTLPDLQSLHEAQVFLRSRRANQQPFFMAVGFHKPHVPLKYPSEFLRYHPLRNVSLPPDSWPGQLPSVAWNPWTDIRKRDDIASLNISFPYGRMPDEWTHLIRQSYYAAVSYIDHLVGNLLKELHKSKLYENTIIVLIGDHGWSLGEHGEWSKFSNFDVAVKVPLILRVPGLTDKSAVLRCVATPVELLDLFPTLVDAAGLPSLSPCPKESTSVPDCTEGVSLMPYIFSAIKKNKTYEETGRLALSQYPRPGIYPTLHPNSDKPRLREIKYMGYSVRSGQYRYTEWPRWQPGGPIWDDTAGAELYDHSIDDREDINLADRPAFSRIRKKLSYELRRMVDKR